MISSFKKTPSAHLLPADFVKHPNTPWDALRAIVVGPFIICIDSFGVANVWSVDTNGINLVTTLQPPLPGNILTWRAKGIDLREYSFWPLSSIPLRPPPHQTNTMEGASFYTSSTAAGFSNGFCFTASH
ncbi:hypothetical protein GGI43DRAFT_407686 [Trichoderma evansii]